MCAPGDEILVTNGVYQSGARELCGVVNRVAVTKPVTVQTSDRPEAGFLGAGPVGPTSECRLCLSERRDPARPASLSPTAQRKTPAGSLTNYSGGAVWCEGLGAVVSNCTLTGNSAHEHRGATEAR